MLEGYINLLEIPVGHATHPLYLPPRPLEKGLCEEGWPGGMNKPSPSDWLAEAPGPWVLSFLLVCSGGSMAEDTGGCHPVLPPLT